MIPIPGSTRSLGLGNPSNPKFLKVPSQVSITPDGAGRGELRLARTTAGCRGRPNGQAATCWSVVAKDYLFVANAGSNTITGCSENWRGQLALLNPSGISATTDAGAVDFAASGNGGYLYQEATPAGSIDEFKVLDDGIPWCESAHSPA